MVTYRVTGSRTNGSVESRLSAPFARPLRLPAGSHRIEIHYTAPTFSAPEKARFQVALEPDTRIGRTSATGVWLITTTSLQGDYVFRARAVNEDGFGNEVGASLAFTVEAYTWQTLWFKTLGLAIFATVLALVIHRAVSRRVLRLEEERAAQLSFTRSLIASQEGERRRVAAELHDGLGQDLLLIKNRLVLAATKQADAAELARQLDAAAAATTRAIGEVRTISHALRPAALDQVGLTKAIEWMVEHLAQACATKFSTELENIDGLLAPEMEMTLFRIIQEGLSNVVRHAGAGQAILEPKERKPQ